MARKAKGTTAIVPADDADRLAEIIKFVTDGLTSSHSVRAYSKAIGDFLDWHAEQGRPQLTKALIARYKRHLVDAGLAPSTINQRLSAIRRLAVEAADAGLIDTAQAVAIGKVKGVKVAGVRAGDWLTADEAQAVLTAPDAGSVKGIRDRAILAVLLGAGLRRAECAALEIRHLAQRDGRPCIVDLVGKGRRVRTVPIAPWVDAALRTWLDVAGIDSGRIFRRLSKAERIIGTGLTPQAILVIWQRYAPAGTAPHDARRSFAKLARGAGASLEQISANLGHASLTTTEKYLGIGTEYTNGLTPSDRLPIGF